MDLSTVKFLAHYNSTVNEKMNAHIGALDDEQWNRKFGGYFSSVRSLCNHLYIADFNWLRRLSNLRTFGYIKDAVFEEQHGFGSHAFTGIGEYLGMRKELDRHLMRFADEVVADDLGKKLKYLDSHGDAHDQEYGLLILHVFNHQTHHRGMISLYLEEMRIGNEYSDIMDII